MNVGPDKPLPADGVIQISFDRYLLPSTVLRQSVVLTDASNQPVTEADAPIVTYDPVARTVTLSSPKEPGVPWLLEGQPYKLFFLIPPDDDADDRGLRAIDRATLDPAQPREIAFYVGPPNGLGRGEPNVSFCTDVLPIFAYKCSDASCHGGRGGTPAAGLVLDGATGVVRTAVGRVAQAANTSGRAGAPEPAGKVFGVNMPVIEPGSPGESWLLYKLELAPPPVVDAGTAETIVCSGAPNAPAPPPPAPDFMPLAPARLDADEIERAILNDYVLGREMPFPVPQVKSPAQQPLTFQEREKIRLWIAQGAVVNECGGCGESAVSR